MKTLVEVYKGYQIRKSGEYMFKVMKDGKNVMYRRYFTVEACKVAIDSQGRVMTPEEHAIVYTVPS